MHYRIWISLLLEEYAPKVSEILLNSKHKIKAGYDDGSLRRQDNCIAPLYSVFSEHPLNDPKPIKEKLITDLNENGIKYFAVIIECENNCSTSASNIKIQEPLEKIGSPYRDKNVY